ncbi:cell division protein FtsL [Paracraurococcus lichenis]|uniref:Cell division protein FtsL n=1 Tax=Paracraurococcus lichenis TaxID=3064888 RepID=A0ABT9E595_9PROT|nr:hypothetical protein [Paracraurococcus sp. LOR1-02]MDO9711245.1 hypothetical protein [Paracraurococcus sp. LOR1-02]
MIFRPISLLTFTGAMLAGLHLYQTKHDVALLDRELRAIGKQIDEAKDRTQALQAEWAWLNEPERLRGVAQRHLPLEPMQPAQFIRLNESEKRLPAVAAYDGPTALFAARAPVAPPGPVQLALLPRVPAPVQVARAVALPEPAVAAPPLDLALPAAPARPEAAPLAEPAETLPIPPPAPVRAAEPPRQPEPAPVRAAEPARHPEPAPRPAEPRHAPVEVARVAAPIRPVALPVAAPRPVARPAAEIAALPPIAAPRPASRPAPEIAALPPVAAPVRPALAQVAAPPPRPTVSMRPAIAQVAAAATPPAPRPVEVPAISLGSALGAGRSLLPPPVPFGSASAATLGTVR